MESRVRVIGHLRRGLIVSVNEREMIRRRQFLQLMSGLFFQGAVTPGYAGIVKIENPFEEDGIAPLAVDRLLTAQGKLSLSLLQLIQGGNRDGENAVVSPAGLASVMAALSLGAEGTMRVGIHKTLGLGHARGAVAASDLAGLRATAFVLAKAANSKNSPLTFASAVVFDPRSRPLELAVRGLRSMGVSVATEDVTKPETIGRINEWVNTVTSGAIPTILDEPPGHGGLVALNAIHFKDVWRTPFDSARTGPMRFQRLNGATAEVPMMLSEMPQKVRHDDRFVAVDLPYSNDRFSLVVLTTKNAPAPCKAFRAQGDWLTGAGFNSAPCELRLPRFKLTTSEALLPTLDRLGLKKPRLSPTAFSGLASVPQTIVRIDQKTFIAVDEQGTEAAAATAVTTTRSAPSGFVKMTVDKPFLFALREQKTGVILLAGYVENPKETVVATR
jgi:serine protease inhibitor